MSSHSFVHLASSCGGTLRNLLLVVGAQKDGLHYDTYVAQYYLVSETLGGKVPYLKTFWPPTSAFNEL